MWFWVRPVWRDLEALRKTARALGEGHFERRAPEAKSSAFDLLTETLNGMAERIQRLIATQKELSSAISHELRTPIARMRFALEMLAEPPEKEERERQKEMEWQRKESEKNKNRRRRRLRILRFRSSHSRFHCCFHRIRHSSTEAG